MRKFIGILCVILGCACIISAICFVGYNYYEADLAYMYSDDIMKDVKKQMQTAEDTDDGQDVLPEGIYPGTALKEMATVSVDGDECIGILSIPAIALELPVLTDWSYAKLKKAPCHYYGSYLEKDFVIAGHNFSTHFGGLYELQTGDIVKFTDVEGNVYVYEVVLIETLPAAATEEMIMAGFDLSLYTCTLDGGSRVTVRCNTLSSK